MPKLAATAGSRPGHCGGWEDMNAFTVRSMRGLVLSGLLATVASTTGCQPATDAPLEDRYVALDAAGRVLEGPGPGLHACVRDLRSGLEWEVKQASGLHARGATFSWYDKDQEGNRGDPGMAAGGQCPLDSCDTAHFVAAVNAAGLCGQHDWRMPSREEATTLGTLSTRQRGQAIDDRYFPEEVLGEYWTATTFRLHPTSAWLFDTRLGLDRVDLKASPKAARLVRGTLVIGRKSPK